jgi:hypothetical protein
MSKIHLAVFGTAADLTSLFSLISEALLASLFAATLLAELCGERLPGKTFTHRFAYAYWRYALPACAFTALIYWLLWHRSTP